MHDLRYQHVEKSLARLHDVREKDMKAFRARIRNLRNLGVPDLPKVGSGTQITYTVDQLHELFFALEFARAGISPAVISDLVKHNPKSQRRNWKQVLTDPDQEYYFGLSLSIFGGIAGERTGQVTGFFSRDAFLEQIFERFDRMPLPNLLVIKLGSRLRELHQILKEIRAERG